VVSTTPRPLYPRERPSTHCTGGWVGPRAGLDVCEKSHPHWDSIPEPSAHSQSLYRLSYPAHSSTYYRWHKATIPQHSEFFHTKNWYNKQSTMNFLTLYTQLIQQDSVPRNYTSAIFTVSYSKGLQNQSYKSQSTASSCTKGHKTKPFNLAPLMQLLLCTGHSTKVPKS
jgi:hypothetical protein